MCIENWMSYITTLQNWIPAGVVGFVATILIKHRYDTKLAKISAQLDNEKNENQSIRDFLYNNLQQRGNLLYEKQLQAIDTIWEKTCELQKLEFLNKMLDYKIEPISDITNNNNNSKKEFETIFTIAEKEKPSVINYRYYTRVFQILCHKHV